MSWDDLEEFTPGPAEPTDPDMVDKVFVAVFSTEPGQQLLRYWKRAYLDQPVCPPGAGADNGYYREGQNSVVREAIQRFIRGTEPQ